MRQGSHLSLFFVVMRGEFDCLLSWPFQQKVTLILMDWEGRRHISDTFRPDVSSPLFKRPRNDMNVASGCPLFVALSTVDGGGYIKNDTMFIKILVRGSALRRPNDDDGSNAYAVGRGLGSVHVSRHISVETCSVPRS